MTEKKNSYYKLPCAYFRSKVTKPHQQTASPKKGIGKATALAFAQKGYITYATDKDISQMN